MDRKLLSADTLKSKPGQLRNTVDFTLQPVNLSTCTKFTSTENGETQRIEKYNEVRTVRLKRYKKNTLKLPNPTEVYTLITYKDTISPFNDNVSYNDPHEIKVMEYMQLTHPVKSFYKFLLEKRCFSSLGI